MLTILAVNPTGMFSFGWMPVIQLDKRGRVFVAGWNEDRGCSNGAGKSSIINSIKEIGFGKNDTEKSGANVLNKHEEWNNGMFGVLWCICRNRRTWRVMNVRKWKGNPPEGVEGPSQLLSLGGKYTGTDVFVEEWDGQQWIDRRPTASKDNKNLRDAQQFIIEEIFGMTYDQFSAYVCLGQKAESALVTGTSGAREKIIQAVADVSVWTDAANIVKDTYTSKEAELSAQQQKISGMQMTLQTLQPPSEMELQEAHRAIQYVEDNHQANLSALAEVDRVLQTLKDQINPADAGIGQELDILFAEERHTRERFENYRDPEEDGAIAQYNTRIAEETATNRADLNKLNHYQKLGVGECSNCGQKVTKKHLEKEMERLHEAMAKRGPEINRMQDERDALQEAHKKECMRLRAAAKKKMDEELCAIEESRQKLLLRKKTYEESLSLVQHQQDKKTYIESQIAQRDANMAMANMTLAGLERRIQDIKGIEFNIQNEQTQAAALESEIAHLKWTERNLKKLRIQEYESALDRLNHLIAERLYELWGPGLHARFITARNTTRGKSTVSQLDFIVDTTKKVGIPIEMYSGGEKKIIIIATFLAMIQLASERGLGVNIAGIDELDEHLDDVNTDKLVEAFESIADAVPTCLVISHNSRLLNTMTFDETWTVHKKNEFATVRTGDIRLAA